MPVIDPSTDVGRLRLRVADFGDIPYLPDSVYVQTLVDNGNNLPAAAKTIAMYILGMLAHKTHRRMAQLEVYGEQAFKAYKEFLIMTHSNPAFMDFSPVPYSSNAEFSPILDFQKSWNANFTNGTEAQQLAFHGDISPNDNTRLGVHTLGAVL